MEEKVKELSEKNFYEFIKKGKCIIDFYADWCTPCQKLKPEFENAVELIGKKIKFGKINIDGNEEIAQDFMVMSVPTLIFLEDGEEVNRINGFVSEEEIIKTAKATFK